MSRVLLYIILALLLLLVGCVGYLAYISTNKPPTVAELMAAEKKAPQRPLVPVVVAAKPLAAGSLISADSLTIEQWPVHPADARENFEGLLGRRVRQDIAAGQPITNEQLVQGLSTYLKLGTRAVTLGLDMIASGSSPIVLPGDKVDLYVVHPGVDGGPVTASLLQARAPVLAYAGKSLDGPDANLAHSAVFAMPVDRVDVLLQAEGPGRIALAVSRVDDDTPAPAAQAQPAAQPQSTAAQAPSAPAPQAAPAQTQAAAPAPQAAPAAKPAAVAKPAATARHAPVKHVERKSRRRPPERSRGHAPATRRQAPAKPTPAAAPVTSAPAPAPTPALVFKPVPPPPAPRQPTASTVLRPDKGVQGIPLLRAPLIQSYDAPAAH